jgi:hypothetical protein
MNIQENYHGFFSQTNGTVWEKQSSLLWTKVAYMNDIARWNLTQRFPNFSARELL